MKDLIILKLGGSAITYKKRNIPKVRNNVIRRSVEEIKKAKEEKEFSLIVVHGAGPYGHKFVTDYGIDNGLKTSEHFEGFVKTHNSMEELNRIVVNEFVKAGLLAFPVQASACIVQENKKIVSFNTSIIKNLLEIDFGVIPIMYGDMVIDKELKASVISGDAIIAYLAKEFAAERVLFGTNVPGIHDKDPRTNKDAELISKIDGQNVDDVLLKVSGSKDVDVTGGMKGKLVEVLKTLKGVRVFIFDITEKDNLYNALMEKDVAGTEIKMV
ncbi:MAG: isopentenyl phosphate kinase [Candidatus Diapherotrites archaeon]